MHLYTLHYSKFSNSIRLYEWEVKHGKIEEVRNRREYFSYTIIDQHPAKEFFNLVKTGENKIEKCGEENKVSFTSDADFGTVAHALLRFKNKYKISVRINKEENELWDLHCFLKIEYVPHLDKPNGDFLVIKNFYLSTIKVTKSFKINNLFEMIMTFKYAGEEYEGIFVDLEGDRDFNIEIGGKLFFNIYTDKTLEELADFLLDSKELKEVS